MGGVPTRATRRFIRLLSDKQNLPVYCFVDCDPYGFTNIYRTLKVGSGNAAHINRFLCVPRARFLGVTPQDIIDFGLEDATHQPFQTSNERLVPEERTEAELQTLFSRRQFLRGVGLAAAICAAGMVPAEVWRLREEGVRSRESRRQLKRTAGGMRPIPRFT